MDDETEIKIYVENEYELELEEKAKEIENYVYAVLTKRREREQRLPTFDGLVELIAEMTAANNFMFVQNPMSRGIQRFIKSVKREHATRETQELEAGWLATEDREEEIKALENLWKS